MSTNQQDVLYDEPEDVIEDGTTINTTSKKASYVGIQSTSFKDFLLKPELLRALTECAFEHPSEVQHQCIPQAVLGSDVLCQAKSGMGKTCVFVVSTLQQFQKEESPSASRPKVLVICHTRELAYQIKNEYDRFSRFLGVESVVIYGGVPFPEQKTQIQKSKGQIMIATPGRLVSLIKDKVVDLSNVKHFVLDECDKCLEKADMRRDVQEIFKATPRKKQVMMFSATLPSDIKKVCKMFMSEPLEILVDNDTKLTLVGLQQFYLSLEEKNKNRKLNDLLDMLEFNQVVIFVKSVERAQALDSLLTECNFPSICIHSRLTQEERIDRYKDFRAYKKRIMVATDLFGRGIDMERVNIVINYDMPSDTDQYLHRVGRAGRFGTNGVAISFISSPEDENMLKEVQNRFEVELGAMPDRIDPASYMNQ